SAAELKQALDACAQATPYDAAAAQRWWQERSSALRNRTVKDAPSASHLTMTVDLLARALRPAR
ncbi:MAG TPA: hypothetical protein VER04_19955, partial [Polyangiaceae bacterium]|nr:hypothetical protein [Polyangiaceae bacterium]